jgi:hypothetical protein
MGSKLEMVVLSVTDGGGWIMMLVDEAEPDPAAQRGQKSECKRKVQLSWQVQRCDGEEKSVKLASSSWATPGDEGGGVVKTTIRCARRKWSNVYCGRAWSRSAQTAAKEANAPS